MPSFYSLALFMSTKKYSLGEKYFQLAKKLKEIKGSKQFGNYKKMAERLGISNQHLSDVIHFRKEPSDLLINSIASAFGVPREQLIIREEKGVAEQGESGPMSDQKKKLLERVKRIAVSHGHDKLVAALLTVIEATEEDWLGK